MGKFTPAKRVQVLLNRRRAIRENKAEIKQVEWMEKYKVPELHEIPPKLTQTQHDEINGRLPFDEDNYHCQEYNDLLKNIIPIRTNFAKSVDPEERKVLATEEIGHWHNYMKERETALPEHYQINPMTLSKLQNVFDRESERRNSTLRSERVVDYHYTFARVHKFDIPIHERNMIQMIHPYHGYMGAVKDKYFTFDEIIKMYRQQLVSSYERSLGQTFLAGKFSP